MAESKKKIIRRETLTALLFIDDAVAEQMKSRTPEKGLENGKRGTVATPQQIGGYRRRPEDIIVDKIDTWLNPEFRDRKINGYYVMIKNILKREKEEKASSKSKTHRGRRSPESLARRANRK